MYYVSSTGNDSNTGLSESQAWRTISKVNSIAFSAGDVINFKKGDTWHETLQLKGSGISTHPIKIKSYGVGNNAKITGLLAINEWHNEGNGIYSKEIITEDINLLTIDGVNTPMARFPKTGWLRYDSHTDNGTTASITDDSLTESPNWEGAQVVFARNPWSIERKEIVSHVGGTFTFGSSYGQWAQATGYFIQKDIRILTDFGDWYYDGAILYVYFGVIDPLSVIVKVATIGTLINLQANNYILIDGLDIEGGNGDSINLYNTSNVAIQNCHINLSGGHGIYGVLSPNLEISTCRISESNHIGIQLDGIYCNNYLIKDNIVESIGMLQGMLPNYFSGFGIAIWSDNGLIHGNIVNNIGYCGIFFRCGNISVEKNFIKEFCLIKDDGGGIYTALLDGKAASVIADNIIINGGGNVEKGCSATDFNTVHGIYLDIGSENVSVLRNTSFNCQYSGIYLHNSHHNVISENTCYDNGYTQIAFMADEGYDVIQNNIVTLNKFITKALGQSAYYFKYLEENGGVLDTLDFNYYARPVDDDFTFFFYTPIDGGIYWKTLDEWKLYSGQDANSQKSPVAASENELHFIYNETLINKVYLLSDILIDVAGIEYEGSVTLQPHKSLVLLGNGLINLV